MLPGKIFGLFYMYGLMISIGILLALSLLFYYGKKKKVEESFMDFFFYNGIFSIAFGFFSATLFQSVYNYLENPSAGFHFGGMTFIGGVIGGVVCFIGVYFLLRKRYKTRLFQVQSFAPCAIVIAHGFGRLGCLFAGCCHGAETDAWYGIYMQTASFGYAKVVPIQLFEALFLFAMFAVMFYLLMKKDFKYNFSVYLIVYGVWRFIIEFFRDDHRGEFVKGLTPSQFWAIVMVVAGVAVFFYVKYLFKRQAEKEAVMAQQLPATEETKEEQV